MSSHNICFHGEIRKNAKKIFGKKKSYLELHVYQYVIVRYCVSFMRRILWVNANCACSDQIVHMCCVIKFSADCACSDQTTHLHSLVWACPIHIYNRLSLSRIPRDSLKHFEISVLRHIRVERVRKTIN